MYLHTCLFREQTCAGNPRGWFINMTEMLYFTKFVHLLFISTDWRSFAPLPKTTNLTFSFFLIQNSPKSGSGPKYIKAKTIGVHWLSKLCTSWICVCNKVHQNAWLHISFLIFYGSLIGDIILLPPEVVLWLVTKILFPAEVVLWSLSEYQRIREMVSFWWTLFSFDNYISYEHQNEHWSSMVNWW